MKGRAALSPPKGTLAWANARFSVRSRSHRANHSAAGRCTTPVSDRGASFLGRSIGGSSREGPQPRRSTAKTTYCQDDLQPRDLGIVHVSADRGNCWARRRSTSGPLAGSRRVSIEFPRAFLRRPHRCAVIAERQRRREGPRVYLSAMPGCAVSDRPRPLLGMMTFRRR